MPKSSDYEPEVLIGKKLERLWLSEDEIVLDFEGGYSLRIELDEELLVRLEIQR